MPAQRAPPSRGSPAPCWRHRSTAPRASCSTSPPARTSPCRRSRRPRRSCARRPTRAPTSSSASLATTPCRARSRSQSSPPGSAARPRARPSRRYERGRRECLQCGQRFTTYERIEAVPFYVTKKDGRREDFDPQKLFTGLKKATEKRDISPERLRAIVDDIEAELRRSGRVEIPSGEIGEMVMDRLRDLDEVAYIRFASVYREFMDLQPVKREIEHVLSSRRP